MFNVGCLDHGESHMPLDTISQEIRLWMFGDALGFWAQNGVDHAYGGFIEELTFAGADAARDYKRTRVTCRQMYVFAHAKMLGWDDGADLIARGAEYLAEKAWQGDEQGFARRLNRDGSVKDPTPDLYDHAFALFGFAWAYRATGDSVYKDWAHKTLDWVEAYLRHPSGIGFMHETPPDGPRLQNPHMHLLEASLAAFDATGEARFRDSAREIAELFRTAFFNRNTGSLAEYFNDDWSIVDGDQGRIAEPGHQLEWAWILQNCLSVLGVDAVDEIRALVRFSEKYGMNPKTGAVMNAVRDDGAIIDAGSRTWPNTERLKAAVALYELDDMDPVPVVTATCRVLFDRYLTSGQGIEIPRGAWIDAFDGDGKPIAQCVPASTFYHIFLAFAEVLRIEAQAV